jgi:hypothetical protein
MHAFSIPWSCLDDSPKPQPEPKANPKTTKTFAQALSNVCDIPLSQFPTTSVKGDHLAVAIPEEEYIAGMEACKHNLHGRIIWPKGATPLSVVDLKKKLSLIWKDLSRWGVLSLGKGYYEFCFSSLEDVRRVRSVVSWNLDPGYLKLFAWSGDFNPNVQKNTTAQVWVRLYGLSQEYWRPKILFAIASSIGTPICTDALASKSMFERTFGQYARVLVDMDLTQTLRYKVLVERKGYAFFVDLDYENLPEFCDHCKMIGHNVDVCKKLQYQENGTTAAEPKRKVISRNEKRYVQTRDGNVGKVTEVVDVEVSNHLAEGSKSQPVFVAAHSGESTQTRPQLSSSPAAVEHQNLFNILANVSEDNVVLNQQSKSLPLDLPLNSPARADTIEKSKSLPLDLPLASPEGAVIQSKANVFDEGQASSQHVDIEQIDGVVEEDCDSEKSSQDSEFVDATQFQKEDNMNTVLQPVPTPERVQKDMIFLKESWANMAEQEEHECIQAAAVEAHQTREEEFQIKLSKNQKKAQKKVVKSSNDSYATRSKVNPKPFK